MKLAVTTICPHIFHDGRWWSYEPFVLEMNVWGDLFERLTLVAPVENGPPPRLWAPYADGVEVEVVPYRRNRGRGLDQETTSILELPRMVSALVRAARRTDALHARCPGSIGLVSVLLGPLLQRRRLAKYAGQWPDFAGEAWTVRLQKTVLRSRWWRAPVTVYGSWPEQPRHIVPFFTSVLESAQVERARRSVAGREATDRPRVLFVGRLSRAKNVDELLAALAVLRQEGIVLPCTLVGDGPHRAALEAQAAKLGLEALTFAGAVDFKRVLGFYETHDILVLASESEGWPKAITEGMAFGLICIGSDRGLIPEMLAEGRGTVVPPRDVDALAAALRDVVRRPAEHRAAADRAALWAQGHSLERLREALRELMAEWWT